MTGNAAVRPKPLAERYVRRRLGRKLRGSSEANQPSGEYSVLRLLSTGDLHGAMVAMERPGADVGADFSAVVKAHLAASDAPRAPKVHAVRYPPDLWDRYAQRAREAQMPVGRALLEAVLRDDEQLRRAQEEVADVRASLTREIEALRETLRAHGETSTPIREDLGERLSRIEQAIEDLRAHGANYGVALTALVQILHDGGFVKRSMAEALKRQGWLR